MTAGYLVFLVVGKLLIYIGMKFARDNEIEMKFLNKLLSCSLCLGFWVYSAMAFLLHYQVFADWTSYIPIFSELVVGAVSSLLVFYVEAGWRAYHEVTVI